MYILVEIIHTEFLYINLIEMQKYNWNRKRIEKRKTGKKGPFVPVANTNRDKRVRQARGAGSTFCPAWCYQPGQKGAFCPGCQTQDKKALLSRPSVSGWETGTTEVSQPGQINISVVVLHTSVLCVGEEGGALGLISFRRSWAPCWGLDLVSMCWAFSHKQLWLPNIVQPP